MVDVFQWISSFPRFGTPPSPEFVEEVERSSEVKAWEAADNVLNSFDTDDDSNVQDVFKKFGMRPGLERMHAILNRLGNPEKRLRFVHIAGTNGKGSTAAFLASMFRTGGFKTGLYTSPYLTEFQDRMSVDEVAVTTKQLENYVRALKPIVEDVMRGPAGLPTEFEIVTLLSILYFSDLEVDVVVWETGLGGRLDSTNVVTPIATIITNIGLEHTEILGNTVEAIAKEKAGIIKPLIPVFTAATDGALQVIADTARANHCPIYIYDTDFWMVREKADDLGQTGFYHGRGAQSIDIYGIEMRMHGSHQLKNASLAIAAFEWCLHHVFDVKDSQVVRNTVRVGVRMMNWAGRFEVIREHPLWILDGAHNPHGTKALSLTLQEWQARKPRRLLMILGVLRDKDLSSMLEDVLPYATEVIATQPATPRALAADSLATTVESVWQRPVFQTESVVDAIQLAEQLLEEHPTEFDGAICIGSLYTISEARNYLVKSHSNPKSGILTRV